MIIDTIGGEFLGDWHTETFGEDEFVIHRILGNCSKVVLIDECLYYQYERKGSITRSDYSLKSLDAVEAVEERCRFIKSQGNDKMIFLAYRDYLRRVQFHYYSLKKYFPDNKRERDMIREQYNKRYVEIKGKLSARERIRYGLFLYFPNINRVLKRIMGARAI